MAKKVLASLGISAALLIALVGQVAQAQTCNVSGGSCFSQTNTSTSDQAIGLYGRADTGNGVLGWSFSGNAIAGTAATTGKGVSGYSVSGRGVDGASMQGYGVYGEAQHVSKAGVYGRNLDGDGVQGTSQSNSYSGVAVFNHTPGGIGTFGVTSTQGSGAAIFGQANNSSTSWAGYFAGRVRATQFVTASDARLKKDVHGLPYGLREVGALRPVVYEWRDVEVSRHRLIGFIAQEVSKTIPELVETDLRSGMLSVNYGAMVVVAIKALQEQQGTIRSQQAVIERQEHRLAALEQRIGASPSTNMLALGAIPLGLIAGWGFRRSGRS